MGYPAINWWKGKLRPYESFISFAASFCELNGIRFKEFGRYFNFQPNHIFKISEAELNHIVFLLGEDVELVQTVFVSDFQFTGCEKFRTEDFAHGSKIIKYCPVCAQFGYHSHLHEFGWLEKCLFHGVSLAIALQGDGQTVIERRIHGIGSLMKSKCRHWPIADEWDSHIRKFTDCTYVKLLSAWIKNVCHVGSELSQSQIWVSDGHYFNVRQPMKDFFGMLRSLEEMPELIKPFFTETGDYCSTISHHFPSIIIKELIKIKGIASLSDVYFVYKYIEGKSGNYPPFIVNLNKALNLLAQHKKNCQCSWALERNVGWIDLWSRVDPNGWPYWKRQCPYEVASDVLELHGPKRSKYLSRPTARHEYVYFIRTSQMLCETGLVVPMSDTEIDINDQSAITRFSYHYKWNKESVLTELLSTLAEFDVDATIVEVFRWLSSIEKGNSPMEWCGESSLARLLLTADRLTVIRLAQEPLRKSPLNM